MNIIQELIPKGYKNRPGYTSLMQYITIHNTGNSGKGSGAKNHAVYLKSPAAVSAPVSWHYTVDDTCAYQHIPDNESAYHAGDGGGMGNRNSIGIEICMNSDGNLQKATDNAAELVARLCRQYNIPVENIVQHNRWNGKDCPQLLRRGQPYTWDVFIGKVREALNAKNGRTRGDCKALIQSKCKFDAPDEVWKLLDAHKYADGLYGKWADSYE